MFPRPSFRRRPLLLEGNIVGRKQRSRFSDRDPSPVPRLQPMQSARGSSLATCLYLRRASQSAWHQVLMNAKRMLILKTRSSAVTRNLALNGSESRAIAVCLRHKIVESDLAAMAGVARENVSRTMSEWRKRDIVTRASSYLCIKGPTALAQEMAQLTS